MANSMHQNVPHYGVAHKLARKRVVGEAVNESFFVSEGFIHSRSNRGDSQRTSLWKILNVASDLLLHLV